MYCFFLFKDDCYSGSKVAGERIRHLMVTLSHHQVVNYYKIKY